MSRRRVSASAVQGALAGMEMPAQTASLFFCLFPDQAACDAIAEETDALRVEHSLVGVAIKPSRLHVTLHYLGEHVLERVDVVEAAVAAAAQVAHAPFEVVLSHAASFSSRQDRHPCVLLCPQERPPVHGLWRELGTRMMAAGLGRYLERNFTPHVTLMYDTRLLDTQPIEPIGWTARDFSLVQSVQGSGEYRILQSWPLG